MNRTRRTTRCGFTLIEALLAISLVTFVFAAGTALIWAVRQAHRHVTAQHANARAMRLLAEDYRRDVGQAESVDMTDAELTISQASGTHVTYNLVDRDLLRQVEQDGRVTHRDLYRFQTSVVVTWQPTRSWLEEKEAVGMMIKYGLTVGEPQGWGEVELVALPPRANSVSESPAAAPSGEATP